MDKRQLGSRTYRTFEIIDATYFLFLYQLTHKSLTFHKLQPKEKTRLFYGYLF